MRYFNPLFPPSALVQAPLPAPSSALPQVSLLMPIVNALQAGTQALAVEVPAGRALTLHVRRAGVLRLHGARVWLTFTVRGANNEQKSSLGDLFLQDGHEWALEAGQSLVLEPFAVTVPGRCSTDKASRLSWQPVPNPATHWRSVWRRWLVGKPALNRRSGFRQGWQTAGSCA